MTKLIIRDDDLSYFANSKYLDILYGDLWSTKMPIHFATIPKVYSRQREVPMNKKHDKDYYLIGDNKELCLYLRQKIKDKKIKIWQHGYTHQNIRNCYELERKDFKILYEELKKGKDYLENLFDIKIDTLVAPHDRFSKEAILAAEKIGYKYICRGFAPLPREVQWKNKNYLKNYIKLFWYYFINGKISRYPEILKLGKHQEIFSYRIHSINIKNIERISKNHKEKTLCITNHYRSLSLNRVELLKILIDKIQN